MNQNLNFFKLFQVFWKEKILIIVITLVFSGLGVYLALNSPDEFTSKGEILPEISGGSNNSLGGLASMVGLSGINLGKSANSDAIRPDLYPDVLRSTPFYLSVLEQPIITKDNKKLKFEDYYKQTFEKGENQTNEKSYNISDSAVVIISKINEDRIKNLQSRIVTSIDMKSGKINISVKMPDPVVAAKIANYSMDYLTNYIKDYRTKKSQKEVDFLQEKVSRARGSYYSVQTKKAAYEDAFSAPTIRLQSADIKRERLEDEYQMSSSLYKELLKQLEEAKLKLQQETPVFQVLNPPVVPNKKSEPKRAIIVLLATIIGFLIALIVSVLIKSNYKSFLV